ncbi:MAG: CinA family protein [Rhodoferax sp.]
MSDPSGPAPLAPLASLAARVAESLRKRGETVSVVEGSAGGLVAAALLAIPGASAYFVGGAVVYTRQAGKALLGLTADDMAGMRAETEPYARLAAGRIRDKLGTSWGLSESGASGPSGSRYGDLPGHVCVAVVGPHARSRTIETGLSDRSANMDLFARQLLTLFDEALQEL